MYKLDKSTNAVFSLHYHFITAVKYRRKVFVNDDIIECLKNVVEQVASDNDVTIIEQE